MCVHPFKYERVRQTRQRENDRWEETERDKGRTGRADFYWQAAQSEVVRLPGPNPSPSPRPWKPVQSGLLKENGTFPSWFLNVPRAFSCLQVTTISDRGFLATTYYNPCIRQMSHREDGQTLVASFLRELGFRSIMAACQAWECVFLKGSANQSLISEMHSLIKTRLGIFNVWAFGCVCMMMFVLCMSCKTDVVGLRQVYYVVTQKDWQQQWHIFTGDETGHQ